MRDLETNGEYLCASYDYTVRWYNGLTGTLSYLGQITWDSAGACSALAMDATRCFVAGDRGSGTYDVIAYINSTRGIDWQITLPTTAKFQATAIACDGDVLYVAGYRRELSAGGNANLFALSVYNGALLWSMDVTGGANNLEGIAVDDKWIYVSDDADDCYVIAKDLQAVIWTIDNFRPTKCDGVAVVGYMPASVNPKRFYRGAHSMLFQACPSDDINRKPFYNLAVPVTDRH